MNKTLRLLIVAFVLVLAGALLAVGTVAIAGLPFVDNYVPNRTTYDAITTIQTDLHGASVLIMPTTGDEIAVTHYERDGVQTISVVKEGECIRITEHPIADRDRADIRNYVSFGSQPAYAVEIAIPCEMVMTLDLHSLSGDVMCSGVSLGDANIRATSGQVSIEKTAVASNLRLELASGQLLLENMTVQSDITISVASGLTSLGLIDCMGDVTIRGASGGVSFDDEIRITGSLCVECSSGTIEAERIACGRLIELRTSSGRILTSKMLKAPTVICEASSGGIFLKGIDADDTAIKTTSGNVRIQMAHPRTAYTVTPVRDYINIPDIQNDGERKLDVRTASGDISMMFPVNAQDG